MQILKEMPDGARVRVNPMTHQADMLAKGYRRIINERQLIVYAIQRMATEALTNLKAQSALVYGGRARGTSHVNRPWNGA